MEKFGWKKFESTGKVEDYLKMKNKEKIYMEEFGEDNSLVKKKPKGSNNGRKSRGDNT